MAIELVRSLGLVRGRDSGGAWRTPFSPFRFGGAKDWLPYDCTDLRLRGDKMFTVVAENFSADNKYVQSVLLNGKTLKAPKISYADIMAGGELRFIMRKAKNED